MEVISGAIIAPCFIARTLFLARHSQYATKKRLLFETIAYIACIAFAIGTATIDLGGAKWDYSAAFTYNASAHTVALTGLPAGVTASYTGNSATNAGKYSAEATFSYDSANYELTNAPAALSWEIAKAKVVAPTAGGEEYTFVLEGVDEELMSVSGNKQTGAGNYTVTVNILDTVNYEWTEGGAEAVTFTFVIASAGLSGGAIAGITIGCLVGLIAIAYAVGALLFKKGILSGAFFAKICPFIK